MCHDLITYCNIISLPALCAVEVPVTTLLIVLSTIESPDHFDTFCSHLITVVEYTIFLFLLPQRGCTARMLFEDRDDGLLRVEQCGHSSLM